MIDVVHLLREQIRLIERRVGRRLNYCEDHSLVLIRRQFALREHVERNHQQQNNYPQGKDNRSVPKGAGQRPRVSITNTIKAPINPAGETAFGISLAQELRPIIGDSVSATKPETITAPARVNANSRNRAPVNPP